MCQRLTKAINADLASLSRAMDDKKGDLLDARLPPLEAPESQPLPCDQQLQALCRSEQHSFPCASACLSSEKEFMQDTSDRAPHGRCALQIWDVCVCGNRCAVLPVTMAVFPEHTHPKWTSLSLSPSMLWV